MVRNEVTTSRPKGLEASVMKFHNWAVYLALVKALKGLKKSADFYPEKMSDKPKTLRKAS